MIPKPRGRHASPPPDDEGAACLASTSGDPRVADALEDYLADLHDGRAPCREKFLARHPEIARELAECLDGLEFLQSAAGGFGASVPEPVAEEAFAPSTRLGDYRIVREVGRGGMGVVYEAEQVSLGRRVALKVLPFAAAIDPRQRQRFRVEAQAAAHLHHPHIVPIFAVGHDTGVPYYAMQFIEGRTLAATIAQMRRFGGAGKGDALLATHGTPADPLDDEAPPTASLGGTSPSSARGPAPSSGGPSSHRGRSFYRAVARLGVEAAEALEHAHGLGVLHRDIKPANLLIDLDGKLWITDFGLARFRDDPGPTRTGDLLGTLRYMSPEQVQASRGIVDQRADVYALGATLYEAFTLRPAFGGRDRQELLHRILMDDPLPPRKIDPALPRDLETILIKAMAKDPSGRYTTAQEMADDLKRFLDDKAILASRPAPLERATRWVRRHRAIVTTAASVFVLAAIVGSSLVWAEQKRNWELFSKTNQGVDVALKASEAVTIRAMTVVTQYGPGTDKAKFKEFFAKALSFYEQLVVLLRDEPNTKRRETLAKAYFGLGLAKSFLEKSGSEDDYLRSVEVYEDLVRRMPERDDLRGDLAESLKHPAVMFSKKGLMAKAESTFRKLVAVQREMLKNSPDDLDRRDSLAASMATQAMIQAEMDQRELASRTLVDATTLNPNSPKALNNLAWLLISDPDRAPFEPSKSVDYARRAIALDPKEWRYWNTLGLALARIGEWKEATEATEKSMSLHGGGTPDDWLILAMIGAKTGDLKRSREHYRASLQWMKRNEGNSDLHRLRDELMEIYEPQPAGDQAAKPEPPQVLRRDRASAVPARAGTPPAAGPRPTPDRKPAGPPVNRPMLRPLDIE